MEAPRTPLTLAQTKLNASAVIQTGSPIQLWRSKEGQDVEWDEFADLEGVVRCSSQHSIALHSMLLINDKPLVPNLLLPPHPSPPFHPVLHNSSH